MKSTFKLMALALMAASGYISAVQAQVVIETGVAIVPSSRSPNYAACLAKLATWLETGAMPSGNATNDPTVFLLPDRLRPEFLMESSGTNRLWFGILNPTNPAVAGEYGNIAVFWEKKRSPQGVRLANSRIMLASNDPYPGHPQGSLAVTNRFDGIGYSSWVPGFIGTTRVESGSSSQLVDRYNFTGFGKYFTGTTPADFDNIRDYVMGQPNFTITYRYDDLGTDGNPVATAVKQWSVAGYQSVRPRLIATRVSGGHVQLTVIGDPNESYTVQSAPTIMGPWTKHTTVHNAANGVSTFVVLPDKAAGFFR